MLINYTFIYTQYSAVQNTDITVKMLIFAIFSNLIKIILLIYIICYTFRVKCQSQIWLTNI